MKADILAMQRRIAGYAAPICPIAMNYTLAASMAVKITRALIRSGPSNQLAPYTGGTWGGQMPGAPHKLRSFDRPPQEASDPFGLGRVASELGRWVSSTLAIGQVDDAIAKIVANHDIRAGSRGQAEEQQNKDRDSFQDTCSGIRIAPYTQFCAQSLNPAPEQH